MASDYNLIDFSDASDNNIDKQNIKSNQGATPSVSSGSVAPIPTIVEDSLDKTIISSSATTTNTSKPQNKSNKSLFEITRVESNHGDSVGGEDSEMDDSVSSSTSVLETISKNEKEENINVSNPTTVTADDAASVMTITASTTTITSITQPISSVVPVSTQQTLPTVASSPVPLQTLNNTTVVTTVPTGAQPTTEPQSRFRIVKIAKQKPYGRGTWVVNDFNDTQKQAEPPVDNAPSSPAVKRNRTTTSESGVTSPTEPMKTKSSEFLAQNFSNIQSRGSSYNTTGDRRSSVESTAVSESGSGTPIVTPMVEALEVALDQIQSIRDSMLVSISDEMKKLRETLDKSQLENARLKDENESLKKKLSAAEDRIASLEKG